MNKNIHYIMNDLYYDYKSDTFLYNGNNKDIYDLYEYKDEIKEKIFNKVFKECGIDYDEDFCNYLYHIFLDSIYFYNKFTALDDIAYIFERDIIKNIIINGVYRIIIKHIKFDKNEVFDNHKLNLSIIVSFINKTFSNIIFDDMYKELLQSKCIYLLNRFDCMNNIKIEYITKDKNKIIDDICNYILIIVKEMKFVNDLYKKRKRDKE